MQRTNFGRNLAIHPRHLYTPANETEVLEILSRHNGQRIRCIGRLHSWSNILPCDDVLLDLRHLNSVELFGDEPTRAVRVGAGCQIKRLLAELNRQDNKTLPSVGFITEQSVAGAISTGTHGSGRHSLSHYVKCVRVACYDPVSGEPVIQEFNSGDGLLAARCSLGCLGVILTATMECRPLYKVEEHFREYGELTDVLEAEKEYPLQQFYLVPWRWTFFAQHRRETAARSSLFVSAYHWYRFLVFDIAMHVLILVCVRLVRLHAAISMLFRWVVPISVIRNWRMVGESSGQLVMEHERFRHVEIELFVHRQQLDPALRFLRDTLIAVATRGSDIPQLLRDQIQQADVSEGLLKLRGAYTHHYPICVRKILPDDTLISMASNAGPSSERTLDQGDVGSLPNEAWYSITLTNYHRGLARRPFEELAALLATSMSRLFHARPHWGKLCPLSVEELRCLYPAFERFRDVCDTSDPEHVFRNQWTGELLSRTASAAVCSRASSLADNRG